ncbi:MAG: hypothetical protein ABSH20_14410 [Tepidisphaeraceae bacterium]|jgi:hypothetical protein
MQKILAIVFVSLLATGLVAQAAAKKEAPKGGPTPAQLEKANDKAAFAKEDTAVHKLPENQGEVHFIPAKLADFSNAQLASGAIIGKLDTPHKTVDGIAPGLYHAYVCKEGDKWCIYYCSGTEVIGKAKSVEKIDDSTNKPSFVENGHAVRYWILKFSW